jgi:hypothetical protein
MTVCFGPDEVLQRIAPGSNGVTALLSSKNMHWQYLTSITFRQRLMSHPSSLRRSEDCPQVQRTAAGPAPDMYAIQ